MKKQIEKITIHNRRSVILISLMIAILILTEYVGAENFIQPKKFSNPIQSASGVNLHYGRIDASDFAQITSFVTVTDDSGFSITGLTENNFIVMEDTRRELPIDVVEITEDPGGIAVALVLDHSGSMQGTPISDAKSASSNFVRLLQPQDRAAVVGFNSTPRTLQAFSNDTTSLIAAIDRINANSGTAIYDALIHTVNLTQPETGRKAIILLTDGEDRDSRNTFEAALDIAVQSDIPVFTIGLSLGQNSSEELRLMTIAENTGGLYFRSPSSGDLQKIYAGIGAVLRNMYRVTYTTQNVTTDGSRRHVKIDVQDGVKTSSDTASYLAPDHVVTVGLTGDVISPGGDFTLNIEIPTTSKILLHKMKKLTVLITFEGEFLNVKQPFANNIIAGALFGPASEHAIAFNVDPANSVIELALSRNAGISLIEGRGKLAHITFETSADMPDSTSLDFRIVEHLATDENNWPIATRTQDLRLASSGLIVWPGDTNRNGRVELTDVTVLGLYWNMGGGGRPTETDLLTWKPQLADGYEPRVVAHSDADGSGRVDERDLIPIGLNWGKTKKSPESGSQRFLKKSGRPNGILNASVLPTELPNNYRLSIIFRSSQSEGISGVMVRLKYPENDCRITGIQAGKAWPEAPLFISTNEELHGELAVGAMLVTGTPQLENGGEILEVKIESGTPPDIKQFEFEEAGLVTLDGAVHEFLIETTLTETRLTPQIFELSPAYPNPFNPSTSFRFKMPQAGQLQIRVYNIAGQLIFENEEESLAAGEHIWSWHAQNRLRNPVSSGLYIVRFKGQSETGEHWSAEQKIVLVR